jgi:ABC-type dipeptide/oligopeptide/nickel transport system ATPase subunit
VIPDLATSWKVSPDRRTSTFDLVAWARFSDGAPFTERLQIVLQDPKNSLDPRMKVGDIIAEPLATPGIGGRQGRSASCWLPPCVT